MYEDRDPNQPEPWESSASEWTGDAAQPRTPEQLIEEAKAYLVSLEKFVIDSTHINWEKIDAEGVKEEIDAIETTLAACPTESVEKRFLEGVTLLAYAPPGADQEVKKAISVHLESLRVTLANSYTCRYVLNATRAVQGLTA